MVERVRTGTAKIPPGVSALTNLIHRDDCAGVLRHVMTLPDPASIYIGVDDEPVPRADILRHLAILFGLPEPAVGEDAGASPWLRKRAGDLGKRLSNRRLRSSGYELEFPTYRQGYASIVSNLPPPGDPGA